MPQQTQEETGRRLDLSVTQVAASALATVVGAVLASELGVYGTVLGAAVVSVGATTGTAVFQHLFRRTGDQLRGAAVQPDTEQPEPTAVARPDLLETADPAATAGVLNSGWNEPQLVRARRRWTWKSYAVVSALVFGLAMVPIVVVELVAGKPMHDITTGQTGSGTSFNPGGGTPATPPPGSPTPSSGSTDPSHVPSSSPSPSTSPSPSPSTSPSPDASPSPTPSGAGSTPTTTGAPTAPADDAATVPASPSGS